MCSVRFSSWRPESEPGLSPWLVRHQVTRSASLLADALVGYLPRYDVAWIVQFQNLIFDNTGDTYKQVSGQVVVCVDERLTGPCHAGRPTTRL